MSVRSLVIDLRARINDVVRTGWLSMTFGLVGLLRRLLPAVPAVHAHRGGGPASTGSSSPPTPSAGWLTAVGITPGGLGVTESATSAALVAWGANPAEAVAGAVLFSVYTHFMEIPLGRHRAGRPGRSARRRRRSRRPCEPSPAERRPADWRATSEARAPTSGHAATADAAAVPPRGSRRRAEAGADYHVEAHRLRRRASRPRRRCWSTSSSRDGHAQRGLATTELTARPWTGRGRYRHRRAGLVPAAATARSGVDLDGALLRARGAAAAVRAPVSRCRGRPRATRPSRSARAPATASRSPWPSCCAAARGRRRLRLRPHPAAPTCCDLEVTRPVSRHLADHRRATRRPHLRLVATGGHGPPISGPP